MNWRNSKTLSSKFALAGSICIAASCWAPSSFALDFPTLPKLPSFGIGGSYYGGAGLGGSSIEPRLEGSGFTVTDSQDGGVTLFLGRDLSTRLSIEGYYSDLGGASLVDEQATESSIDYSTFGVSGLLYLFGGNGVDSLANRRGLNIYGRLGAGRVNNEGRGIDFDRTNDWNWSGGFGAEYNLKNGFGLRSEVHTFDSDARVVSFNIVKRFQIQRSGGRTLLLNKASNPLPISDKDVRAVELAAVYKKDSDDDGVNDRNDLCNTTAVGLSVDDYGCDTNAVLEGVTFDSGSSALTGAGSKVLSELGAKLVANDEVEISIQAHTDNQGSAANNMSLSRKRAAAVVRHLVNKSEVEIERVTAIGYGESRPLQSNQTAAGREANRRVEIKIVE